MASTTTTDMVLLLLAVVAEYDRTLCNLPLAVASCCNVLVCSWAVTNANSG
jgi:hypothetical protein